MIKKAHRKPKLLVIHTSLLPYRIDIFNALAQFCELELALLAENNADQNFDQAKLLSNLDVDPIYVQRKFKLFNRDFPSGINNMIERLDPDIVVTDEFSVTSFIVAFYKKRATCRFKHVIWTDDSLGVIELDKLSRRVARKLLIPFVDGWFFISLELQRYYKKHFDADSPSAIIPVTHDEHSFRRQLINSKPFFEKNIIDFELSGKCILLFVGRLVEVKSIDKLIRAFLNVIPQIENALLVIVGEGEEREYLEALVLDLGIENHVKFMGRYEGLELVAWYRVGQVFALSSRFEPFGAVVNEALIAGMPAVVSSHAGSRSLIEEGVNGSVVLPDDEERFAGELIKWLGKAKPLKIEDDIRANLMNSKFEDVVTSAVNLFNVLMRSKL